MTTPRYIMLVPALLLVLAVIAGGALLNRVDIARREARVARDDARTSYEHAAAVRSEMTFVLQHQNVTALELAAMRAQLAACRRRTEWLRELSYITDESGKPIDQALPGFPAWPPTKGAQ